MSPPRAGRPRRPRSRRRHDVAPTNGAKASGAITTAARSIVCWSPSAAPARPGPTVSTVAATARPFQHIDRPPPTTSATQSSQSGPPTSAAEIADGDGGGDGDPEDQRDPSSRGDRRAGRRQSRPADRDHVHPGQHRAGRPVREAALRLEEQHDEAGEHDLRDDQQRAPARRSARSAGRAPDGGARRSRRRTVAHRPLHHQRGGEIAAASSRSPRSPATPRAGPEARRSAAERARPRTRRSEPRSAAPRARSRARCAGTSSSPRGRWPYWRWRRTRPSGRAARRGARTRSRRRQPRAPPKPRASRSPPSSAPRSGRPRAPRQQRQQSRRRSRPRA